MSKKDEIDLTMSSELVPNCLVTGAFFDGKYVYGAQFHPEKSGKAGLKILENFAKL